MNKNIVFSKSHISSSERSKKNGHHGMALWMVGLSGSGKSTLAKMLERKLFKEGRQVYVLDGDNIRHGLSSNLGFSVTDRKENMRRVAEVAKLFCDAGFVCIVSLISPFSEERKMCREILNDKYNEIYIEANIEECEKRDVKGLYKKARNGEIPGFTGIDSPFEVPKNPDYIINTDNQTIEDSFKNLYACYKEIEQNVR